MNRRPYKALNFESTAKVSLQMGVQQLCWHQRNCQSSGKIIRRYVLRCERKRRQVIAFVSSNFHGLRTTARNLFILTRHYHKCGFRAHTNFRMTLRSIITTSTIFIMVSRRTSAELDVADPPENTWRWKENCRYLRYPPKVSKVMNSTYFKTSIKFDLLQLPGGSTVLLNLIRVM